MTKKWTIIQNVIATILQAWALFFLYTFTDQILSQVKLGTAEGVIKSSDVNYFKMLQVYHVNYILGVLAFYGGLAMLYDKKGGWIASAASCLIVMGFMFVSGRNGLMAEDAAKNTGFSLSYLLAGVAFAVMFVLLMAKPFRQKYQVTTINWLIMGGIVLFVVIDKQLF